MRTPNVLPLALLLVFHPALHASTRTAPPHQHTSVARQYSAAYHPAATSRHRLLALGIASSVPETVNPPARTTVFAYLVNLIRGFFSQRW